ncbi:MAG: phosphoribosylformylglycinamidine cyclo-ligase, partial [Candidatus Aenigmarchaeota archaeon]|nr:phosphoribosylformylglycinamidine cyclo-ligase [Candidatus Aenigmarchaeota archaeon]
DGVGTKTKVAAVMGKWDSLGKDIVNHCANDILAIGAEPFYFLDYVATEKLSPEVIEKIVGGMAEACSELGIPIVGGETAEMPGVYSKGEHDIVGCITGIVSKEKIVDGSRIEENDVLISLPSSGLHTNGFSLARKTLFPKYKVTDFIDELGMSIGEALLVPHKAYVNEVKEVRKEFDIHGIAHITGGGLIENIPRIIPKGLGVEINKAKISVLPIFRLIEKEGNVPEDDMWRTFNMGVGMVLMVPEKHADNIIVKMETFGIDASVIGKVVKGNGVKFDG